jgi:hypothetical protein
MADRDAEAQHQRNRRRAPISSNSFMRLALAAVLLVLVSMVARSQVRVGRDSSTRLARFGRDLLYGTGLGLAYAGVDQLRNDPPEWGKGRDGYGKRAASDVGEFLVQEGTTEAVAAILKRPLDYERCPCRGLGNRLRWALWGAVTDPMPNGSHPLAVPRIVGAYAGSFAQASWRPATSDRARTALVNGTVSLLIGAGINLFEELRR